ncbi:MAG: hypothetical protein NTX85_01690 [Candidatus Nomurabacteria bacterium]|nr:hypothetical protein [Candidatus Nomurabacteria bacterium]
MSDTTKKDALNKKARKNKFSSIIVKDIPTGIEDLKHEQHSAVDGNTKIKGCKEPVQIIVKPKKK